MKIRIKTYNGELPSYLAEGKVYEVIWLNYFGDPVIDRDSGGYLAISIVNCISLNGGSWEVVSE